MEASPSHDSLLREEESLVATTVPQPLDGNAPPSPSARARDVVLRPEAPNHARLIRLTKELDALAVELRANHPHLGKHWRNITFFKPCPEANAKKIAICRVQAELKEIQRLINAQLYTITPISRFPSEILSTIFLLCLPDPLHDFCFSKTTQYDTECDPIDRVELWPPLIPLILSRICRVWRSTAMATPGLWANIVVLGYGQPMGRDMVLQWIARTKGHDLTIQWLLQNCIHDRRSSHWVFEVLRTHSRRWRHIRFKAFHGASADASAYFQDLPAFVSLQTFDSCKFSYKITKFILQTSPNLRRLIVDGGMPVNDTSLDFQRFSKLTTLQICSSVPAHRALDILRACPSLVSASFQIGTLLDEALHGNHGASLQLEPLAMSALTDLSLRMEWPEYRWETCKVEFMRFFMGITIPHLLNLDLSWPPHLVASNVFNTFLIRSSCRLRSLHLDCDQRRRRDPDPSKSILPILQYICVEGSLEVLDICLAEDVVPALSTALLSFMTLHPGHITIPRLRRLSLRLTLGMTAPVSLANDRKLAAMLKSRFTPPLRSTEPNAAKIAPLEAASVVLHRIGIKSGWSEEKSELHTLKTAGFPLTLKWARELSFKFF